MSGYGRHERWIGPGLVVLLAVAVRSGAALHEPLLFDDGPRFLEAARLFFEGQTRSALAEAYHPLTSLLIALTASLFRIDLESAGRLISIGAGALGALALYALARRTFGERVALVSALLFAVFPRMVAASSNVQSDGLHLAFFLGGALLVWRVLEERRFLHSFAAGVLCGLAYLTRPEGLAVGLVLATWLLVDLGRGRIGPADLLRAAGGFAAAALLFGGPYLWLVNQSGEAFVLSRKKSLLSPALSGLSLEALGAAAWEVMRDFQRGWELLWALVALGVRRGRPSRATLYLCSYTLLFTGVLLAVHLESGYISRRHWIAPAALLLPIAARGLLTLGEIVRDRLAPTRLQPRAVAYVSAALIASLGVYPLLRPVEHVKLARKQAALWLSGREVGTLAAERLRTVYYAGAARYVPLPDVRDPQDWLDRIRSQGAEFVVAEEERLPVFSNRDRARIRELHHVEYPGGRVVVLQIQSLPDVASPPEPTSSRTP
ncbi:MAG: ArnT family glycosyltransferase [Myxococcota bacterium]